MAAPISKLLLLSSFFSTVPSTASKDGLKVIETVTPNSMHSFITSQHSLILMCKWQIIFTKNDLQWVDCRQLATSYSQPPSQRMIMFMTIIISSHFVFKCFLFFQTNFYTSTSLWNKFIQYIHDMITIHSLLMQKEFLCNLSSRCF